MRDKLQRPGPRLQHGGILGWLLGALVLLVGATDVDAMDIEIIQINAGISRTDGVLSVDPYYFDITVEGTGIAAIQVTTPMECIGDLVQADESSWFIHVDNFGSLLEIRNDPCIGFGNFSLDFSGTAAELDSVTLFFDPGNTDPFTGYGDISSPLHLQTNVALEPTFQWSCTGTCGAFGWDLQVVRELDGEWIYSELLGPSVFTWSPGVLEPDTYYCFWNQSTELIGGEVLDEVTDGADPFQYGPTFQSFNEVCFTSLARIVLTVTPSQLSWTPLTGVLGYDVVRGDLDLLQSNGGNFTLATDTCVANDEPGDSIAYTVDPLPGEKFWFLTRGVTGSGGLSYESLWSSQVGTRDDEINLAAASCP